MSSLADLPHSAQNIVSRRHFLAVVAFRELSIEGMARACQVSARHLWYVASGARKPSAAVLAKLRAELGEPCWLFVTGQADTLRDAAPTAGAQP